MADDTPGAVVVGFIFGVLFTVAMWCLIRTDYEGEAIRRGYATHNAKTGKWEWVEPKPAQAEAEE